MSTTTDEAIKRALRDAGDAIDFDRAKRAFSARADDEGLVEVAYASVDSPFGEMLLAATDRGVVKLALPSHAGSELKPDLVLTELAAAVSPRVLEAPARLDPVRRELD